MFSRFLTNLPRTYLSLNSRNNIFIYCKLSSIPHNDINSSNFSEKANDLNKNLSNENNEKIEFDKTFNQIKADLTSMNDLSLLDVSDRLDEILNYNLPNGKKNRGMALVLSYHLLSPYTDNDLQIARIIGWCVELLQSHFLMLDDIVDQSKTRRGKMCWYKKDDVGLVAINDSTLLNSCIFQLLNKYIYDKPYYKQIVKLFHQVTLQTAYGQCLDLLSNQASTKEKKIPNFHLFTQERYDAIVKYKTALYSFCLPVRAALYMSGIDQEYEHKIAEDILIKMGHFFQVQDDYLDCYGNPEIIGKIGTDIQEGKCTWLAMMAFKLCSPEQREILVNNYGINDENSVRKVKNVYKQLRLDLVYSEFEKSCYKEISSMIQDYSHKSNIPSLIFYSFLAKIYKRKK